MFLTSRMNFMILGHDLEVLWKKTFVLFIGHFWGRLPFDPKIFAKKCPFKLKNWLLAYFCMGNPKKIGLETICWPPRFQLRRFLLKSTLKTVKPVKIFLKASYPIKTNIDFIVFRVMLMIDRVCPKSLVEICCF